MNILQYAKNQFLRLLIYLVMYKYTYIRRFENSVFLAVHLVTAGVKNPYGKDSFRTVHFQRTKRGFDRSQSP
jgi:hypothetical protein